MMQIVVISILMFSAIQASAVDFSDFVGTWKGGGWSRRLLKGWTRYDERPCNLNLKIRQEQNIFYFTTANDCYGIQNFRPFALQQRGHGLFWKETDFQAGQIENGKLKLYLRLVHNSRERESLSITMTPKEDGMILHQENHFVQFDSWIALDFNGLVLKATGI